MTRYILAVLLFLSSPALAEEAAPAAAPAPEAAAKAAAPLSAEQRVITGEKAGAMPVETPAAPNEAPEVTELKKKAMAGDGAAQSELGRMYAEGDYYVERNYDEAMKWHQMGANNGVAASQYYIAFVHEKGINVTQNSTEAFKWYQKAAAQGDPISQSIVGKMYANGRGVEQDWRLAYFWLALGAKNGDPTYGELLKKAEANVHKRTLRKINGRVAVWKPTKGEKALSADPADYGLDGE